jgi:hypothetical protein
LSAFLFPIYVAAHIAILSAALYLGRVHKAPGAWLTALIAGALVYDNLIVSLGTTIGIGDLLQTLSWPRFAMHALFTPFMMVAVTQMGAAGGIRWTESQPWKIALWVLVAAMIVVGAFESLVGLETAPACFNGIIRYTSSVSPSQLCFEGQPTGSGGGPPIPSIVGNLVALVVGFGLWRQHGWVWLMLGSLIMFAAAAVPIGALGMAASNGGEVVLMTGYVVTVARFGRFRKSPE